MVMHLARAVSTLFLHNGPSTGSDSYLYPAGAHNLRVFLPLLSQISIEAANSQYIAFQFLDLLTLKVDTDNLGYLITTANSWMASYPSDTSFWIERTVGRRICSWLTEAMNTNPAAFSAQSCPASEIDALLDNLLRLGLAMARQVEETFARVRASA
jgi:hypothetical protein